MAAELGRQGAEFVQAAVWRPQEELSKLTAESLGRQLQEFLKTSGLSAAPLLISIGRNQVVLKEIGYPAVPTSEEPGLVRFQATKDLTDASEDVVLDYSTLTEPAALGERRALAVILRRDILNSLRQLCQTANVRLLGIVPRPFGMAGFLELARQRGADLPAAESPTQSAAVVLVGQRWAEVSILQGSKLFFCRSLGVGPTLPAEIRRCLALYTNQANGVFPRSAPEAVYVAMSGEAPISLRSLHDTLGVPVYDLRFLNEHERGTVPEQNQSALESGFGLLHAWSHKRVPVDLANPKEPAPVVDMSRRRLVMRAAVAAILLVVFWFGGQILLGRQQTALESLNADRQLIEERFKAQEQDRKDLEAMKDWDKGAISWIDEFYDLAARFPRDASFRLTKIQIDPITSRADKERFAARMTLHGVGDSYWVHKLNTAMNDAHIQAKVIHEGETFSIRVDLVRQPPGTYRAQLNFFGGQIGAGAAGAAGAGIKPAAAANSRPSRGRR